jgi:hypothetical protein
MNSKKFNGIGVAVMIMAAALAGCCRNSEDEGAGEQTGAALDRAAESTADAAKTTGEKIKETTGKALEKTGEVLESAGAAVEKTGDNMQK